MATREQKKKPGRPRAEDRSPMLPARIIQAYGETGSLERTAARVGVAPNTVKALLMRHPDDFAAAKKALATRMLAVADDATTIAGERLGECSSPQAAVVAGIMAQRGTELLGQGTPLVQINLAAAVAEAQAELERLRASLAEAEAEERTLS
jgi:hypothetical protein